MTYVEDYRISQYRQQEIDLLRKIIKEWQQATDFPEYLVKTLRDADMVRNEIKKIEEGRVPE